MELLTAIASGGGKQAPSLLKHLSACGLNEWEELTKGNLFAFRDHLLSSVSNSSARTYFAVMRSILARFEDSERFCKDYRSILKTRNERPVKTYLSIGELCRLERTPTRTATERLVLCQFLIGAYTGMRLSDIREVTKDNVKNGCLSYVSIKTGTQSVVPCSDKVAGYIHFANSCGFETSTAGFENIIRRLCKRAGINSTVKVFKAGKHLQGQKWQFVSSHTARISFCTNLSKLGVPLIDISQMAGHSSVAMTERYIVKTEIALSERAMQYFGK